MGGQVLWSWDLTCVCPWVRVFGHLIRSLLYSPPPMPKGRWFWWVRQKGNWKNKLELLKGRWLRSQLFLWSGKWIQHPWNFPGLVGLQKAPGCASGLSPPPLSGQNMNCPLTLVWPHCSIMERPMSLSSSALLRRASSALLPRAPANARKCRHQATQFKETETADAWKKQSLKKLMALRVEQKRSKGQDGD